MPWPSGFVVKKGSNARARVADAWRPVLNRLAFDVSDPRVNDAFRASQMYLLENRNGILPRSGPLAHDAFWVRDAAYIGEALERIGDTRDNQGKCLIAAPRQSTLVLSDNQSGGKKACRLQ